MAQTTNNEPQSNALWRQRIEKCKRERRMLVRDWADNVQFRKGKPFEDSTDEDRINVNLDWSKTKAKHANLFSQVPTVNLTPKHPQFAAAVPVFAKQLNDTAAKEKVGTAMDEAVLDTINASGIGIVVVGYERRTEPMDVPSIDLKQYPPAVAQQMVATGQVPMTKVDKTTSKRFPIQRISPSDFLWPTEFTGSDFDAAPWVGRTGLISWAEAKNEFGLKDDVKAKVINGGRPVTETIQQDTQRQEDLGMVEFDEIYYWSYKFNPDEKYFDAIRRIVFVVGIDKPVIDEPWKGQKFDPQSKTFTGARNFPIRVLTLTYITDDAIPPSDSAIGRPQVLELIKSRSQMILQRDRSVPIRWADSSRIDPAILDSLMKGTWQAVIPTIGDGSHAIGEVARASYPREDMEFDRVAKADLDEAWQTSANQAGSANPGQRSASEVNIVQANFQTRIGYERARVATFFVGIMEVLAGLLALYGDFTVVGQDELQKMDQSWDRTKISQAFVYDIRPDSTVLLDANQRIQRLMGVLNMVGKSGFVDVEPIISEILSLAGLDPTAIMHKPQPPPEPPANISLRLTGSQDLLNPLVLAFLLKTGQAPGPQEVEAAKQMLLASQQPPQPPPTPGMGGLPPLAGGAPPTLPTSGGAPSGAPPVGGAHPDWNTMSKVSKRSDYA